MRYWNYYNPTEIHFGLSFPEGIKSHLENKKTLYVTSPGSTKRGVTEMMTTLMNEKGMHFRVLDYANSNPSFRDLEVISEDLKDFSPEQIVAVGGGSVIDLGKILSYSLSKDSPELIEIFRILKSGKALPILNAISFIASPTTAGTGSEVTPFATLWDMDEKKKYSVVTPNLHPKKALLFPELTLSLPWEVTLSTGLDSLSQCLESIWNKNHISLTTSMAQTGIALIFEHLPKLKENPKDLDSRAAMMEASLISGMCISKTRTAMAHSISYPLTAHFGTPHGLACSFTLPELWSYNLVSDEGRLSKLSKSLDFEPRNFSTILLNFLKSLNFAAEFSKTIKSKDAVLALTDEMFSPGRADNNSREFTKESLQKLILDSMADWI